MEGNDGQLRFLNVSASDGRKGSPLKVNFVSVPVACRYIFSPTIDALPLYYPPRFRFRGKITNIAPLFPLFPTRSSTIAIPISSILRSTNRITNQDNYSCIRVDISIKIAVYIYIYKLIFGTNNGE